MTRESHPREGASLGESGRLPALDILRAVAVILVLFRHKYVVGRLFQAGWIGVDLFFVLSGFLVGGLLFKELDGRGRIQIARFLVRRGFKIYPSYFFFLIVSVAVLRPEIPAIASEVTFLQNYPGLFGGRVWYHTWSLAVEEHFYVLLPVVLMVMVRAGGLTGRRLGWLVAALGVASMSLRWLHVEASAEVTFAGHYEATHLRMDSLFFGVLIGYLQHRHPMEVARTVRRGRAPMAVAAVALLMVPFIFPVPTPWLNVAGLTGVYVGFGIVLVLALHGWPPSGGFVASRLGRALAQIGRSSYNTYLWHALVLELMLRHRIGTRPIGTGSWYSYGEFLVYASASLVVGHLATVFVERPFLRLRETLVPGPRSDIRLGTPLG